MKPSNTLLKTSIPLLVFVTTATFINTGAVHAQVAVSTSSQQVKQEGANVGTGNFLQLNSTQLGVNEVKAFGPSQASGILMQNTEQIGANVGSGNGIIIKGTIGGEQSVGANGASSAAGILSQDSQQRSVNIGIGNSGSFDSILLNRQGVFSGQQ